MKNIKKIAQELLDSDPKGSQIEDDVSLCEYVSKTQGIELTLKEAERVRVEYERLGGQ